MLNRVEVDMRRVFNLLKGSRKFEEAVIEARESASQKRLVLVQSIERATVEHAARIAKAEAACAAAELERDKAMAALTMAQQSYGDAWRVCQGAISTRDDAIAKAARQLRETADRRIYRLRDWAESVWHIVRQSYQVSIQPQRNAYTGVARQFVFTNSDDCAKACGKIKAVIERCDQLLLADYVPDPLPELVELHAKVYSAAQSVEVERRLPALDLKSEEPSFAEEALARREAVAVVGALPALPQ